MLISFLRQRVEARLLLMVSLHSSLIRLQVIGTVTSTLPLSNSWWVHLLEKMGNLFWSTCPLDSHLLF